MNEQAEELVAQYVKLTGREARVAVYEFLLFDYFRAGFTPADFVIVLTFLLRENKRNKFQYSLKLGHLINDHARFMDLLGEAKVKLRNTVKPATPREQVLQSFRPVVPTDTATGSARHISSFIKVPI